MGILPDFIDIHGILTLILTIFIIIFVQWKFKLYNNLKVRFDRYAKKAPLKVITIIVLIIVGIFSLWLTVRVTSYYFIRYSFHNVTSTNVNNTINIFGFKLTTINNNYNKNDVFDIITYALTTNLIFTLVDALIPELPPENQPESMKDKISSSDIISQNSALISNFILVGIQAVIIGLIIFMPKNAFTDLYIMSTVLNGTITYVLLIGILVLSLLIFVYLHEKVLKNN